MSVPKRTTVRGRCESSGTVCTSMGCICSPGFTRARVPTMAVTRASTSAGSVTVRNMTSALAASGTTLALIPPPINPMLWVVGPKRSEAGQSAARRSCRTSRSFSIADSPSSG